LPTMEGTFHSGKTDRSTYPALPSEASRGAKNVLWMALWLDPDSLVARPPTRIIACPLENFDATGFVAALGVRSYVASFPIDRDRAGTEHALDRACATCHRRCFQNC
jgi:hypothetical protein